MKKQKVKKEQEQGVFNEAKKGLKNCFNLELSLIQQIELKSVWVREAIRDSLKPTTRAFEYCSPAAEAAARFMWNNYTIDKRSVRKYLTFIWNPVSLQDNDLQRYIDLQQDRMHYP